MLGLQAERAFDGDRALDRATVLLDGDRIVAAGEPLPASVEVVDLPGCTLLPGLIDTHQHLVFDGSGPLEEQVAGCTDDELQARARANARRALEAGVTTIRDLGDRDYLTLDLRHHPDLPTILCSGPPITRHRGHCWYLGGECDQGVAAVRAAVAERAARGCDVVKVMATGGVGTPGFPPWEDQFTPEELQAIVDAAHEHALPVAAHCHGITGIVAAADVGVDTIEHCTFMNHDAVSEADPALLRRIAASGSVISADGGALAGGTPPPIIQANIERVRGATVALHELGATLVFGTDAGIAPVKPHDVLPRGLAVLVEHGMPPLALLRGVTSAAADACRATGKGRLVPGADADLLAVEGDPLADVSSLAATTAVWKGGRRIR